MSTASTHLKAPLIIAISFLCGPGVLPAIAQASRPTTGTAPAGPAAYQPGIRIDWRERQVEADATVVMREGLIEVFACSPGNREYEAIVRMDARPLHLFQALGLIGLTPGHPIRFNPQTEKVEPPTGDSVSVEVRWEADGRRRQEPIENWMRLSNSAKPVEPVPWVFAGSVPLEGGGITADVEGTVVALVDFSSALIAPPERHSDSNEELWLEPATSRIPAVGTRCTLLFSAGPISIILDSAGRARMGGKTVMLADAAREVAKALRDEPKTRVLISVHPRCPEPDRRKMLNLLRSVGVPQDRIEVRQPPPASEPAHDPQALQSWLRQKRGGQPPETNLTGDLRERSVRLKQRTEAAVHYTAELTKDFQNFLAEPTSPESK